MRFAVLLLAARAFADVCHMSELPCSRAASAPVVFSGTVSMGDGASAIRMRVDRAIRGIETGNEIRVSPSGRPESFAEVRPGDRWLVMGTMEGSAVRSGWCDGMRRIEPDSPVARMVEALSGGPNLVAGRLLVGAEPLAGAAVRLSREGSEWTAASERDGWFEWRGIPDGSYRFLVESNTIPIHVRFSRNVEVPVHGCAEALAYIFPAGQVDGFVFAGNGLPLAHFPVIALEKSGDGLAVFPRRRTESLAGGSYSLTGLREGSYLIAVEPPKNPLGAEFTTRYYPAADSVGQASPVNVSNRIERGIDIRMGPRRAKVPVTIRVVFADGRPATGAMIRVELDGIDLMSHDPRDIRKSLTGSSGLVRQELLEGEEYEISAAWARVDHAGPPKVISRMSADALTVRAAAGSEVLLVLR